MVDKLTPDRRSENMRRIRASNSAPEMQVRSLVHRLGYRFRLGGCGLPGRPDLVFPARRKVIFVHGCFWHLHDGCREGRVPGSNVEYWRPKLERNVARDKEALRQLSMMGWAALTVWECETSDLESLTAKLRDFLE